MQKNKSSYKMFYQTELIFNGLNGRKKWSSILRLKMSPLSAADMVAR